MIAIVGNVEAIGKDGDAGRPTQARQRCCISVSGKGGRTIARNSGDDTRPRDSSNARIARIGDEKAPVRTYGETIGFVQSCQSCIGAVSGELRNSTLPRNGRDPTGRAVDSSDGVMASISYVEITCGILHQPGGAAQVCRSTQPAV